MQNNVLVGSHALNQANKYITGNDLHFSKTSISRFIDKKQFMRNQRNNK